MRVYLFAALLALASTPALAADDPEPKYKGKPLAYWIERLQTAPTDDQQKAAAEAVASFGRDIEPALPQLLAMLEDHSPEFRGLIEGILREIGSGAKAAVPVLARRLKENKARHPDAIIRVLRILDADRTETVAALIVALDHREARYFAVTELCRIKPVVKEALPALRRVAMEIVAEDEKNPSSNQNWAQDDRGKRMMSGCLYELHYLGEDAIPILLALLDAPGKLGKMCALQKFAELGSLAVKSAPALKKLLKHDDPQVRYLACRALWKVAESPDVVPVLVQLLDVKPADSADQDFKPAMAAAILLGEIGPAAKGALPALNALARKQQEQAVAPAAYPDLGQPLSINSAPGAAAWAIKEIESKEKKSLPRPLDRY